MKPIVLKNHPVVLGIIYPRWRNNTNKKSQANNLTGAKAGLLRLTHQSHRKSTHKIKTTKQNQEKSRVQPQKKWRNKRKGYKNERKTEAKRTKAPTQNPERSQSELRTQSPERTQTPERKKEGCDTPQKMYASFCEMKPIVLKYHPVVLGII